MALRLLADRRDELAGARTRTAARRHRLLLELIPAGAPRYLSAPQAKALLATVRPRDLAGRTRRQLAAELLADIVVLDRKLKDSEKRLTEAVAATGTGLPDLYGIGPVGAARILGDVRLEEASMGAVPVQEAKWALDLNRATFPGKT
ncbi:MAG TPA: hypothetical protein VE463_18765, partial [Blastococcus sp.]|nr:hypothetical protein [Blastococcus sp.]